MSNYRFIYFDAGLTLLECNHTELFKKALEDLGKGREKEEIELAYHLANKKAMRENLFHTSDGGTVFASYFLSFLSLDIPIEDFHEAYTRYKSDIVWKPFPFTPGVLERLKRCGYGLGILSNWDPGLRDILRNGGIYDFFDQVIISSETGFLKPDENIFRIALEKAGLLNTECLLVGDNYYDDVLGAAKAGMKSVLINPEGKLGIEEIDYSPIISSIEELPGLLEEV